MWCWIRDNERGANLIEYSLLILMIAVVAILAVAFVGEQNSAMWSEVASSLDTP